jgi:Fe-S cluster assembly ATP-binding protein
MLSLKNVSILTGDKKIIDHLSLNLKPGELQVLMGPNGSGKSTLSLALAGHPSYTFTPQSHVTLKDHSLLSLSPDQRAQAGLFLTFQHPVAIPGLSVQQLIKTMLEHLHPDTDIDIPVLRQAMLAACQLLHIPESFLTRSVNEGFSGGEQKRLEMLQLILAKPRIAIIDEIDSGLDIDAITVIAQAIEYAKTTFKTGFLIVTHYRRIVDKLHPDQVHILVKGHLVQSGDIRLINQVESQGYAAFTQKS